MSDEFKVGDIIYYVNIDGEEKYGKIDRITRDQLWCYWNYEKEIFNIKYWRSYCTYGYMLKENVFKEKPLELQLIEYDPEYERMFI